MPVRPLFYQDKYSLSSAYLRSVNILKNDGQFAYIHSMPAFKEVFIQKQLEPLEYNQLLSKGYLKLRIDLSLEHLRMFQSQYRVGDTFTFQYPSKDNIDAKITSVDTGEPEGDVYRIYIGLTLF
jgi:hypothetical protein